MPSSPADPAETLRALARTWDDTLAAVSSGDMDRCAALLDAADELLARPMAPTAATGAAAVEQQRSAARSAHARLHAVLQGLHAEVAAELSRARQGRRALSGYGGERRVGGRLESRA